MESPPGGRSRGGPPPSSPEQGVWGDIDDWHETLELIARKWGGGPHAAPSRLPSKRATEAHALPNQQPSPAASKTHEGGARTREKEGEGEEKNVAAAATAAGAQLKQPSSSAPPALLPGDKSRNRRSSIEPLAPSLASPAVDSPRNGGSARSPHSPSRKQRHTASLPRPSDVEALLRKETQRRRPSSPAPQAVFISSTATHADDASLAAEVNGATATSNGESDGGEINGAPNLDAKRGSSAYSAPTDLRDAFVSINHAAGAPNNEGLVLSLLELQKRPVPSTLNKATLEVYLSDDEFSSALGMPRDQFYSLRAWKQTQVKKKAGLL